ncbi:MAG: hypothetical protein IK092_02160, partial [Muribaculaceae bacterium]|nr:hypothetical protein [Muribaculaceae bacterium]
HLDQQLISLEMMNPDSTWSKVNASLTPANEFELLRYTFPVTLEPSTPYRLRIEPEAAQSIYGLTNDTIKASFTIKSLEEYGNITLRVNAPQPAFVQLLDSRDTPIRTVRVENGKVTFAHITPGDYYARVILDTNGNGYWDTGNYNSQLQPEHTLYYPKRLRVRKNWELDENWDVFATPLDTQKPDAIKRNKPNKSRNKFDPTNKKNNNEEDDDDEFNSNSFGRNTYSGNKYQDFQNSRKRK